MKDQSKKGGPAFPTQHVANGNTHLGMTMRDYFAAAALPNAYAAYGHTTNDTSSLQRVASEAYQVADAMLEHRLIDETKKA